MLEHPEITNAIRTGYPDGESEYPCCPVCGKECETIYWNITVVGCDRCITKQDAWEYQEEFYG